MDPAGGPSAVSSAVVLGHGLGGTGASVLPLALRWSDALPSTRVVVPTGLSVRVGGAGAGASEASCGWCDFAGVAARDDEPCGRIEDSAAAWRALVAELATKECGVAAERVVLAGFSQGGACSVFTAVTDAVAYAGVVSMSG